MNVPPCVNGSPYSHDFASVVHAPVHGLLACFIRICTLCGMLEVHWADPGAKGDVEGTHYYQPWSRPEGT